MERRTWHVILLNCICKGNLAIVKDEDIPESACKPPTPEGEEGEEGEGGDPETSPVKKKKATPKKQKAEGDDNGTVEKPKKVRSLHRILVKV